MLQLPYVCFSPVAPPISKSCSIRRAMPSRSPHFLILPLHILRSNTLRKPRQRRHLLLRTHQLIIKHQLNILIPLALLLFLFLPACSFLGHLADQIVKRGLDSIRVGAVLREARARRQRAG